jgi:hypothetical protein
MSSQKQLDANCANAQLSTGPKTPEGKAKSSLNAVKTGLTGRTVLLPGDDAAAYDRLVRRFFAEWKPETDVEHDLVQSIADTEWRLLRIPALEMGIYAVGRLELAGTFAEEDEAVRNALIDAKVFLTYQRQLNNLSIQETRLRRQRDKDVAALKQIHDDRKRREQQHLNRAAIACIHAKREGVPFRPDELGFEFPLDVIERKAAEINPRLFADSQPESPVGPRQAA